LVLENKRIEVNQHTTEHGSQSVSRHKPSMKYFTFIVSFCGYILNIVASGECRLFIYFLGIFLYFYWNTYLRRYVW